MAVWEFLLCTLCRVWGWWDRVTSAWTNTAVWQGGPLSRVRVVGQSDLSLDKYCGVTRRTFVACEGGGTEWPQPGQILRCDKADLCRVWGWWDRVTSAWTNTAVWQGGPLSRVRVVGTEWDQSGQILRCDKVDRKLQALVYDILPSTTAVFSHAIESRKLSANEYFFVGAQTVVRLLQTTQIKQGVSVIAANKVYTSANKTTIVWVETELSFFFYPCLRACLGARLLPQSYQYPNLSEGADRVGGQLHRDKECPFSGVTKSGRVRRVPESDTRSVGGLHTPSIAFRHLPPNSARFSYATEGALFISAQLSSDAVSTLRKVWVLIRLWKQPSKTWGASTPGERKSSNDCGFICAGVNFVGGYKWHALFYLSCL